MARLELDSVHGLGSNDLSLCLDDLAKNEPISRTDYDDDEILTSADLPIWLEAYGRGGWVGGSTRCCA